MDLTDTKYIDIINKIRQPRGNTFGNVTDLFKDAPNKILFLQAIIYNSTDFFFGKARRQGIASYLIEQTELHPGVGIQDFDLKERRDVLTMRESTFALLPVNTVSVLAQNHSSVSAYLAVFLHVGTN